jgi:hypothetical protein
MSIQIPAGMPFFSPGPKPLLAPICESPIGKLWALFRTEPRDATVVGSGLVVRLWLFGRYQDDLSAWEQAGRPHVCGKQTRSPARGSP